MHAQPHEPPVELRLTEAEQRLAGQGRLVSHGYARGRLNG
jgi:hypothetical protein